MATAARRDGGARRRGDATRARFLKKFFSRDEGEAREEDEKPDGDDDGAATGKPEDANANANANANASGDWTPNVSGSSDLEPVDMKTTLSDLDALLGIDSEAEAKAKEEEEAAFRATLRQPSTDEDAAWTLYTSDAADD